MTRTESPSVSIPCRSLLPYAGLRRRTAAVRLQGEHDVWTAGRLWETSARAVTHDDVDLVIDVSGVEFTDAATVGVIIEPSDHLRLRSRTLALPSPSRRTRRAVDLQAAGHGARVARRRGP